MKKTIVITNQSSGYLTTNIANAFFESNKYDEVVLLAGNKLSPLLGLNSSVKVIKISEYDKRTVITRTLSWVKGLKDIIRIVKHQYKEAELFLISNPPVVAFLPLFLENKYTTLIYDVYPNGLVDAGFISKKNVIFKIWAARNKKFFDKAQRVFTITNGMADSIACYCDRNKVKVVSLWSNPNLPILHTNKEDNIFVTSNNLQNKFVVMYSGNMGKGHDLDVLVDVANILRSYIDIVFLFVGEGFLKPIIQEKKDDYHLNNVVILPYQDRAILPYSLSCADLAVVSTNIHTGKVCIPSKTFDLMKLGVPILCISEPDSDISKLVNFCKIGQSFSKDKIQEIAKFIIEIYQDPSKKDLFVQAARKAAINYTSDLAINFV